ncbi:hypothetical protein QTJ16_005994 [Diplocarpon rosae]|uniref:LAGLIDADG homing endonuclease n=1 Tax=Diplocarpon rosae TaxID=946125 RepID=A0AAD9SW34_9HELO|nr:hypothetical protein QTJ16_005994 [Diplocarpon rosae]
MIKLILALPLAARVFILAKTTGAELAKQTQKLSLGRQGQRKNCITIAAIGINIRTALIVCINTYTVQRALYQSSAPKKVLDGVAVISAIISAADPKKAATELLGLLNAAPFANTQKRLEASGCIKQAPAIIKAMPLDLSRLEGSLVVNIGTVTSVRRINHRRVKDDTCNTSPARRLGQ